MTHKIKLISREFITHNVLHLVFEKPEGIDYTPGQAADISISKPGWEKKIRPFTFTSLPKDEMLEFTIKSYTDHHGVTNELRNLQPGDELLLHEVFGTINYRGEGVFIAGGAGVTPFISIFKDLKDKDMLGANMLIFANKKEEDIILKSWFAENLRERFVNVLSEEALDGYAQGYITKELLQPYLPQLKQQVYLCGPDPMMEAVKTQLLELGVSENKIAREGF